MSSKIEHRLECRNWSFLKINFIPGKAQNKYLPPHLCRGNRHLFIPKSEFKIYFTTMYDYVILILISDCIDDIFAVSLPSVSPAYMTDVSLPSILRTPLCALRLAVLKHLSNHSPFNQILVLHAVYATSARCPPPAGTFQEAPLRESGRSGQ